VTGGRLVVYGNVRRGKIKEKTVEGFTTISFCVRHRHLDQQEIMPVAQMFASALTDRSFIFQESNSFIEKSVVTANISEVARFFIAMALTLDGRAEDSILILENLRVEVGLKRKSTPRRPQIENFYNCIVQCLLVGLGDLFAMVYDQHLVDNITKRDADVYARKCETILDRERKLSPGGGKYYLQGAILSFHFGNMPEAKRQVANAKTFFNKTNAAPYFSAAFLALWEGFYNAALREYLRAARCPEFDHRMILGVLSFLDGIIETYPEKKHLRFGLAFVNDNFLDKTIAIKEYSLFLEETQTEANLKVLHDHARERQLELQRDIKGVREA